MSPKTELFSIRIEEDLAEQIEEIIRKEREETPEYEDDPKETEVQRQLLRAGVQDAKQNGSDVARLNRELEQLKNEKNRKIEELEKAKQELQQKVWNPSVGQWFSQTLRAPLELKTALFGIILTSVCVALLTLFAFVEIESVPISDSIFTVLVYGILGGTLVTFVGPIAGVFLRRVR